MIRMICSPRASLTAGRGRFCSAANPSSRWLTTARHVIQINQEGEETAEFDDRPARFLFMERNPCTGKVAPVLENGRPVYYYLASDQTLKTDPA